MNPTVSAFSCVLCGGNTADLVVREAAGRTIVRCQTCSMTVVHPFPSDEELNAIYQSEAYFGADRIEESVGYSAYAVGPQPLSSVERARLNRIERLRPQRGTLLDLGCAYGGFLLHARNAGWQPIGIELSEPAAKAAREQFGLNVITGTLQAAALPDESVEAVTLWEVIEHVRSPLDDLREIARILKPGGVVALSTPNAASLRARQEGPDWYGYHVSREHLLYFSPGTLSRALASAGFHVAYTRTRRVDPSLRRLLGRRTVATDASAECHPGVSRPSGTLRSKPVQLLIGLREIALKPFEAFDLGHNMEMYGIKTL